jgi:hypothetical protein
MGPTPFVGARLIAVRTAAVRKYFAAILRIS